jgi:hypothetical protein
MNNCLKGSKFDFREISPGLSWTKNREVELNACRTCGMNCNPFAMYFEVLSHHLAGGLEDNAKERQSP